MSTVSPCSVVYFFGCHFIQLGKSTVGLPIRRAATKSELPENPIVIWHKLFILKVDQSACVLVRLVLIKYAMLFPTLFFHWVYCSFFQQSVMVLQNLWEQAQAFLMVGIRTMENSMAF